jgi:hypothetical protein
MDIEDFSSPNMDIDGEPLEVELEVTEGDERTEQTECLKDPPNVGSPIPERTTIAGIEVDVAGSIEPDRIAKVLSARRKIPLQMMFRPGGMDGARSAGMDHYVAVVCYDTVGKDSFKVSNLIVTGSTEAIVNIADPSEVVNGLSLDRLKGVCLLIFNPVMVGPTTLRIESLRSCLRLGSLKSLGTCSHEGCSKPVLVDRDGALCYQHAVATGVRVTTGGTTVNFPSGLSVEDEERKKRERKAKAPSADEKAAMDRERRKQELIAKKKTALMLLNRTHGASKSQIQARLSTGTLNDDMIDIGETEISRSTEESKLERFKELKRKREQLEKKEARKTIVKPPVKVVEPVKNLENRRPLNRKSLTEQLADQIKAERGY